MLLRLTNSAEDNQHQCIEGSGQWLENVDRAQLVLASATKNKQNFHFQLG